jgi:hypothetical protein
MSEDTQSRVRDLEKSVGALEVGVATITVTVENLANSIDRYTSACEKGTQETQEQLAALRATLAEPKVTETPAEWLKANWLVVVVGLVVFALVLDLVRGDLDSSELLDRLDRIEERVEVDAVTAGE